MHEVSIVIGDKLIRRWNSYSINVDMTQPGDQFDLALGPAEKDLFDICAPDSEVSIRIDGTDVLTGFIDSRSRDSSPDGATLSIEGRCKIGRLLDESMPLGTIGATTTLALARKVAGEWFDDVVVSNADNRNLIRGKRAGKARSRSEPVFTDRKEAPKKVEPGQSRWEVFAEILKRSELLAWSTGDGSALVLQKPNYDQDAQFYFFGAGPQSPRASLANVEKWRISDDLTDRYKTIQIYGASKGTGESYGNRVTKHAARFEELDDGSGHLQLETLPGQQSPYVAFQRNKHLIITDDDLDSGAESKQLLTRAYAERLLGSHKVELTVTGHDQRLIRGEKPALYAPDVMCVFVDEEAELHGAYMITQCRYYNQGDGEFTDLTLVPRGTILTS